MAKSSTLSPTSDSFHAIETWYRGYRFRSRLEARWAVFFTEAGIPFEYETQGYAFDGQFYLPDFWLPVQNCWCEIKPADPSAEESYKAERVGDGTGKRFYVLVGDPMPKSEVQTLHHLTPGADRHYLVSPEWDAGHLWAQCSSCKAIALTFDGREDYIRCECSGKRKYHHDTPDLLIAYRMARAERFD